MSNRLEGKRVAFLMANEGVEQVELTEPLDAVSRAGAETALLAPESGQIQGFKFDALVLPGGVANPDQLRTKAEAVEFVRSFFEAGKPVAAICHAPWTLIEADVVRDRTVTSWPSLQTDLRNAGAEWVEEIAEGVHEGQRSSV